MTTETDIASIVESAARTIPSQWPLHSFVAANPLQGFEHRPFPEAVQEAEHLFGGRGYPDADVFRRALREGRIDPAILQDALDAAGHDEDPDDLLTQLAKRRNADPAPAPTVGPAHERIDRLLAKWLAAFLDEGQAAWPMPDREEGFYAAFRSVARHDPEVPGDLEDLPADAEAALEQLLADYPRAEWEAILEHQFASLPGWTGLVKQREADEDPWQAEHPIDLVEVAAVRLALADRLEAPIEPHRPALSSHLVDEEPPAEVFLSAWEQTYRRELVGAIQRSADGANEPTSGTPRAQLVFCIDTRSEVIRRHIEDAGPYETHGYAGFFGVPMTYSGYRSPVAVDACPPIVDPEFEAENRPLEDREAIRGRHDRFSNLTEAVNSLLGTLKTNAATAFSFVENTGAGYGLALTARTLLPGGLRRTQESLRDRVPDEEDFCAPESVGDDLTLTQKVDYAAGAFDQMGWTEFAPLVVFVGHASESANNPFEASLDCGACAGNPGGPSARTLARICNEDAVREELREHDYDIPEDTVFLAGEHNTTTDEITLFPPVDATVDEDRIDELQADLETARARAAAERTDAEDADEARRETERRAADWSETRPEWGLAGNAGFVVGPRSLTADLDLDGRAFLHSYRWDTDPDGDALEAILTGPWTVTWWINLHYYFASIDNPVWGSGSKVTQNPVGNVGTYQGNGGDLAAGLPRESLTRTDGSLYHQPLRLSTVVHAPAQRVESILREHEHLDRMVANGWISLTVIDPRQGHAAFAYEGEGQWAPVEQPEALAEETDARRAEIKR